MRRLVQISKFLVGVLFIFSGFVKADDPLGFSYKLQEYFEAFGPWWKWAIPTSFPLACGIPILEMLLGVMVLIGARKKFTLWMLLLMTLFFAFLTFYTAHYNKVLECGCFGDAIPMTAWQSFYKNVVLLVLIGIIAIGHKHYSAALSQGLENTVVVVFLASSVWFTWYCYSFLPVIDFRPYKVGTDIKKDMKGGVPDVLKYYYTLKNKKSGEVKEFDKFPDNYQVDWDYVSNRTDVVKKGIEAKIHDFTITDLESGINITDSILSNPDYSFLIVCSDITKTEVSDEVSHKLNSLYDNCTKHNIKVLCLTASGEDDINAYKKKTNAQFPFANTDDTQLRTMIRSNPGVILIKDGIVIAMWHYHRIPDYKSLNQEYFHK